MDDISPLDVTVAKVSEINVLAIYGLGMYFECGSPGRYTISESLTLTMLFWVGEGQ